MLRTEQNLRHEIRPGYRGGKGELDFLHLLEPSEYGNKGRLFARLTLSAGGTLPYHTHNGDMEILYALEGQALLSEDGENYLPFRAGDVSVVHSGSGHALRALPDSPFVYLAVVLYV